MALLLALSTPACASAEPAPGDRHDVRVIVFNCYASTAIEASIDGTALPLTPSAQRDDTVAVCYEGAVSLGPQAEVRVRSQGSERRIILNPTAQSRFLLITPGAPYALLARDAPLLD
ncbi:MAG: hypothetical protein QOI38_256 [Sphingomonadales bacterium]|jgi:hypothetical protein|nr:hypothetical protein [Sphingomonadales bacterium]